MNVPPREGGTVPDGFHSGERQPYVLEHFRLGPLAQLRPFHGSGVPLQRRPTGAHQIPGVMPVVPPTPPKTADSVRPVVCRPVAGYSQTAPQVAMEERIDIGWDMEARGLKISGETAS